MCISGVDPMKNIAVKFLAALSLAALMGSVAFTSACPAPAAEGEGE